MVALIWKNDLKMPDKERKL